MLLMRRHFIFSMSKTSIILERVICGSPHRRLWTGIRKLRNTTACSGDDSLLLRNPSGGHAGVRQGEGSGQGVAGAPGGGRRPLWSVEEGSWMVLCISSSKAPPLYSGEGCTLPLHQGSQEAAAKGRRQGGGGQGRAAPQKP
jgi:hypothetical protein